VAGKPLLLQLPASNLWSELCLSHIVMVARWLPLDVGCSVRHQMDGQPDHRRCTPSCCLHTPQSVKTHSDRSDCMQLA
jgi:hypothetical protein